MIKATKKITLLLFYLCITVIIADVSFFVVNHSDQTDSCDICTDLSGHFDHTHAHSTEHCMALNETKTRTVRFIPETVFGLILETDFPNNFFATIWQPPKNA